MSTTNAMSVGDTFTGTLDTLGDNDWVSVTLTGGARYTIDLLAAGSGNGTLADSYLRIHDANGALVAENDDGGAGYDSRVTVTATTGGSYFISAGAYNNSSTGTYQVQVSPAAALNDGTLDDLATYLTDGYWASVGGARHSFDTTSSNIITANLTALDSRGQALARNAMEAWEAVADIRFQEITGSAQITFDDSQSGAYTSYSTLGSSTQNATVNISTTWLDTYGTQYDDYSQSTYIHELGHALGLGHQGPYNGSASYPGDAAFTNDSYQLSVMSYFSQSENTDVTASYALQLTAMAADIVAIQTLYGAPGTSSQTAGDTVYGAGQTVGGYLGDFFTILATGSDPQSHYGGGPVTLTLYDQGGIDLVDVSFDTFDQVIDLGDLGLWNTGGLIGNVIVARGTVLENVSAGSGNDHVIGNSANNTILGNNGNDTLDGGVGDDLLNGGVGADVLIGGSGQDTVSYEGSYGSLRVDLWFPQINTNIAAGDTYEGVEHLIGSRGFDNLRGTIGDNHIQGMANVDYIFGRRGADTLEGGVGDDVLFGGVGGDHLDGGSHRDRAQYSESQTAILADLADPSRNTGEAAGDVYVSIEDLAGGAYDDVLFGDQASNRLFGRENDDQLFGRQGNDYLNGGGGADTLDGGLGDDTLRGGATSDTFVFNGGHDVIEDFYYDHIQIDSSIWAGTVHEMLALAVQQGNDMVFDLGNGNSLTLNTFSDTTLLDTLNSIQII